MDLWDSTAEGAQTDRTVAVLLPLPLAGAYDYAVPGYMSVAPGDFVRVPLGKNERIGVVWGEGVGEVAPEKLKPIIDVLPARPLPDVVRRFVDWVAAYTLTPPGAVLRMAISVPDALHPPKPVVLYGLGDVPFDQIRQTPARKRLVSFLSDMPPLDRTTIQLETGVGAGVVKGLVEAGVLAEIKADPAPPFERPRLDLPPPALSAEQTDAAEALRGAVRANAFSALLLDGITGSGKTEVYFEGVAEALAAGKQVLVLLPEISLSAQWLRRFEARFGVAPAVWHSELTQARRRETWRAVAEGTARLVVGARSALFLPFAELGFIVVDEEHEHAFKQEDGVAYQGRDMAVVRAHLGGHPVVLVSATPSLETVANVEAGKYRRLVLSERHGPAVLPDLELIDIRRDKPERQSWLTPTLKGALAETLAAGEQALLFLNRRGYAPLTLCRTCGHRLQCPNCTAWLVEHRKAGRLQCHHCGHSARMPDKCPECGERHSFAACGPGVERLYEELMHAFPEIRAVEVTSETMHKPADLAELSKQMEAGEIDVLIGTQILAKGHHFPKLTLVGVVDADLGLAGGDLRAAERSYQLLQQVAGRAGRAEHKGRVLLQTAMPDHPVMQALVAGGRDSFVAAEMGERQMAGMPPFGRLAALIVSGRDEQQVDQVAWKLGATAPHLDEVLVLGPAPAPLSLLRGQFRRRLLVRADRGVRLQPLLAEWLKRVDVPNAVRVKVDIDPYGFM